MTDIDTLLSAVVEITQIIQRWRQLKNLHRTAHTTNTSSGKRASQGNTVHLEIPRGQEKHRSCTIPRDSISVWRGLAGLWPRQFPSPSFMGSVRAPQRAQQQQSLCSPRCKNFYLYLLLLCTCTKAMDNWFLKADLSEKKSVALSLDVFSFLKHLNSNVILYNFLPPFGLLLLISPHSVAAVQKCFISAVLSCALFSQNFAFSPALRSYKFNVFPRPINSWPTQRMYSIFLHRERLSSKEQKIWGGHLLELVCVMYSLLQLL